jgi:phage-related protein
VRRKFEPFDAEVIKREFFSLPVDDAISLKIAMKSYQDELGIGYRVENYGSGLEMLTDSGRGQGRCLFVCRDSAGSNAERLIVLLIYKKESQKAPAHVVATARKRMERLKGNES